MDRSRAWLDTRIRDLPHSSSEDEALRTDRPIPMPAGHPDSDADAPVAKDLKLHEITEAKEAEKPIRSAASIRRSASEQGGLEAEESRQRRSSDTEKPGAAPEKPVAEPTPGSSENEPVVGSRMVLLSKSEVRYEGTISHVDAATSSVTLQNARCFGTEGRPAATPVPAGAAVLERISFQGSDIKDLQVYEPATAAKGREAVAAQAANGAPVKHGTHAKQHSK